MTVVILMTSANVAGAEWSWCKSKWRRIAFKRSIADAAVDGVMVQRRELRKLEQVYRDLMSWLDRLASGEMETVTRRKIVVPLAGDPVEVGKRFARYQRLLEIEREGADSSNSEKSHERLQSGPEESELYHTLFRSARESWTKIPCDEMVTWFKVRSGRVIGDFGCGEAQLALNQARFMLKDPKSLGFP